MQPYLAEIFDRVRADQKKNLSPVCPRCGRDAMRPSLLHNCLSRDKGADVYVCTVCGTDEALRDLEPDKKMRLSEWAAVKKELEGKTFLDLLCSGREFDCDLIIGDTEMPATFVWNSDSALTVFGTIFYAELMESPYEELPNGNIEVFSDNYIQGEHFTMAAAGHIGLSEYNQLFCDMELAQDDIAIDRELTVDDNTVTAYIETWFDVDKKFGVKTKDSDATVNFYAAYAPKTKRLRCYYVVRDNVQDKDSEREYYPSAKEVELITAMMEETCRKENGCDLHALWRQAELYDRSAQDSAWFITDDSCWQCCREISEKVFELIQICGVSGGYDVARATVDLDAYTAEQWLKYINLYGHGDFMGFIKDYDMTFPMRILAEYIFETDWDDFLEGGYFDTFDAAARYVAGIVDCKIEVEATID
jgi:hypothetical protein